MRQSARLACLFAILLKLGCHSALAAPSADVLRLEEPDSGAAAQVTLEAINRNLTRESDRPDLELKRGLLLIQLGREADARAQFQSLRERYPQQPAPYVNLAALHVHAGELDQARQMLEMALERAPGKTSILESLANIHLGLAWKYLKQTTDALPATAKSDGRLQAIEKLLNNLGEAAAWRAEQRVESRPSVRKVEAVTSPDEGVRDFVEAWRQAWQSRQMDAFLSYYGSAFVPEGQESRSEWQERKSRIFAGQRSLRIKLKIKAVEFSGDGQARVHFTQNYRAGSYRSRDEKVLDLGKVGGAWKILAEYRVK